jgi:predicted ATPase
MIKTPDQRVRVFISSTIQELAEERASVKKAIEKLRLIPVLFEIGARFHPPKELYRAYLEQSDIFIGIYWNSYGWVGPDMDISGLEDEYDLSAGKSKLIYVKTSHDREQKLDTLLNKIREQNSVCYKPFKDALELQELVENDLAISLSEYFHSESKETPTDEIYIQIPVGRRPLIGREKDLDCIAKLMAMPDNKLISIIGTGGTGKTSMAMELADRLKHEFKHGVVFFSLASISEMDQIPSFLASKFKLEGRGDQPIREILISWLSDKQLLMVLDNLEQIIDIRDLISDIIRRCAGIRILCTSRTPLHLLQEHIYPLDPLPKPGNENVNLMKNPAMQLFVARAEQVNPRLDLNEINMMAIRDICNQVDGLPLAIELAAMRTRYLPPYMLLDSFHRALDLGSKGPGDLPERQQTLSNTIAWSYKLLDETHQLCFRLLAVFKDGWTIEAADSLIRTSRVSKNAESIMESLLDVGLVHLNVSGGSIRYNLYVAIREYAMEQLIQNKEAESAKKWHSDYYTQLASQFEFQIHGSLNIDQQRLIIGEYENIATAFNFLIEKNDLPKAWMVIDALSTFWGAEGKYSDALQWMHKADVRIDFSIKNFPDAQKSTFARVLQLKGTLLNFRGNYQDSIDHCLVAGQLFDELGNKKSQSWSLAILALASLSLDRPEAALCFERSIAFATSMDDPYGLIISYSFYVDIFIKNGQIEKAFDYLSRAEAIAKNGHYAYFSMVYLSLGNCYVSSLNFSKAIESFHKSLDWFEQSNFKAVNGWALLHLANCYFFTQDIPAAVGYYKQALANARNTGNSIILLFCLLGISLLLSIQERKEDAVKLYLGALNHISQLNVRIWSSNVIMMESFKNFMQPTVEQAEHKDLREIASHLTIDELIAIANRLCPCNTDK